MTDSIDKLLEKAKKTKLIFFDIDDTLRDKETGFIPDSVKYAFETLKQKHILTGIATGRNLYGIVPEIFDLEADFYVTINGSYVENSNKEVIYKRPIPDDIVRATINWLQVEKSDFAFFGSHEVRVNSWNPFTKNIFRPFFAQELREDLNFYKNHEVYQFISVSDHDEKLLLPSNLAKKIRKVPSYQYISDIFLADGSKADGVRQVLRHLGLKQENLMTFGDGLNDLELAKYAGLSVAMKKSHARLLEEADYITTSLQQDGIYKALKNLEII